MPVLILILVIPVSAAALVAAHCILSGERWKKWASLAILALTVLPLLMAVFGWTVLEAMDMDWRAGVKTCCGLSYTAGVLLLLAWAGKGMVGQFCVYGELANCLIGCFIVLADALLCIFVGLFGVLLSSAFGSDRVVEWEEELVVVDIDAWDSHSTYYAYHGPLVRGGISLEDSQPPYYADARKAKRQVSQELTLELPPSNVAFYMDTHGGFHGDGSTYTRLEFYEVGLPDNFWFAANWRRLPFSENLAKIIPQIPNVGEEASRALEAKSGYYYFLDRHDEAENDRDDSPIMERYSQNFTVAVYDTDTQTLHFIKLDT